jgi:hypothetical protein
MKTTKLLLLIGFLLHSYSSFALASQTCRSIKRTIADQIGLLEMGIDLNLGEYEFLGEDAAIAGYSYDVDATHAKGLYARSDTWRIGLGIGKTKEKEINEIEREFGIGVQAGLEAKFIRFLKNPCQATLLAPYAPRRMPLKSKIAMGDLFGIGDYFNLKGSSGLVLSSELLRMFGSSSWGGSVEGNFFIGGSYQIHLFKISESVVRLKIVADARKRASLEAGIGYEDDVEIFKVESINDAVIDYVGLRPIEFTLGKENASALIVDYVLDLSQKPVAEGFDQLMRNVVSIKNLRSLAPFKNLQEKNFGAILDLSGLENLHKNKVQGVNRKLSSKGTKSEKFFEAELGNFLFKLENGADTSRSVITFPDENKTFVFESFDTELEHRSFVFSYMHEDERQIQALYEDKDGKRKLEALAFNIEIKRNRLSSANLKKMNQVLLKFLPDTVQKDLPEVMRDGSRYQTNHGLWVQLVLSEELFESIPTLAQAELRERFQKYVKAKGLSVEDFFTSEAPLTPDRSAASKFTSELLEFGRVLEQLIVKAKEGGEVTKELKRLSSNVLFKEAGAGFLMDLAGDEAEEGSHLELFFTSDQKDVSYFYGDDDVSERYEQVEIIKAALDDNYLEDDLIESFLEVDDDDKVFALGWLRS